MVKGKQKNDGSDFFKPKSNTAEAGGGPGEGELQGSASGISKGEQAILASMEGLHKKTDRIENKVTALEERLETLTAKVSVSEQKIAKLEEDHISQSTNMAKVTLEQKELRLVSEATTRGLTSLEKRLEVAENAVRASNLRILGIPAQAEGEDIVTFMGTFFTSILELEVGKDPPLVIKAYRIPSQRKSWGDNGAGTMLVTLADVAERDRLMSLARKRKTMDYDGHRILIFPDLGPASQEKRIKMLAFRKELIEKNTDASVLYPARLKVIHGGKTYLFTEVNAASAFMNKWRADTQDTEL